MPTSNLAHLTQDTRDFSLLEFLCQRQLLLIRDINLAERIGYGKIIFEYRIADGVITFSQKTVVLDKKG